MGNWCQDKSMGGCPAPIGGSELNSGEDICAHMTYTEECSDSQISCDSGYSNEGCWFGNYCIDTVNSWDAALVFAATCATGTPKNGATWASTPTGAGWATGARTSALAAALTSTWSARGASWRSKRPWHTAPTLDRDLAASTMLLDPPASTMARTFGPTMALTMATTIARAPTMASAQALPKILPKHRMMSSVFLKSKR